MSETVENSESETPETLVLPLDGWHRAKGGRMVEFAGYWMPVQYEGIMAEHLWTRENAGLFDVSHMGQIGVAGPDGDVAAAAQALEALLPGDISALKPGRIRYSMLLNEDGGILDDLMVLFTGKDYSIVVNGATKWDDIGHLREHLPDEITLSHFDEQALLALQGPKAADALGRLGIVAVEQDGTPVTSLKFMQADIYDWNGTRLGISRSGYTGEDGYEISVPAEAVAALADALCAQPEVKPIGLGARDSLRLEAGLPLYGHDLNESTDPVSAGLTFALSKRRRAEGGFPGAKRILKLLADGAPTNRVGLTLEGRQAAREGALVFSGDRQVGVLTSGGFSPSLERPIAMAYVDSALAAPGTKLEIDVRGKRLPASVVPMPFIPHRYFR
ncbi:MAG: glycine cleavage system aminomethyltransferase GcvT [Novosphingobium sp.]